MSRARHARRVAVRFVKPLVSGRVWQRLRGAGGSRPPASDPSSVDPPSVDPPQDGAPEPSTRSAEVPLSRRSLPELATHFGTNKWGVHRHAEHYERHLGHLKDTPFTLLEIGIGGGKKAGQGGASLRMWKHFFVHAQILGLDVERKSFVNETRIQAFRGNQTDERYLQAIMHAAGAVRVVIDDGSHRPSDVRRSFEILFPLLEDGGLYVIEDTQTSYWPRFGGSPDLKDDATTMALVKSLVDGLNHQDFREADQVPTYTDTHVAGVFCYHNIVFIQKGDNSARSSGRHH